MVWLLSQTWETTIMACWLKLHIVIHVGSRTPPLLSNIDLRICWQNVHTLLHLCWCLRADCCRPMLFQVQPSVKTSKCCIKLSEMYGLVSFFNGRMKKKCFPYIMSSFIRPYILWDLNDLFCGMQIELFIGENPGYFFHSSESERWPRLSR